MYKLVLQSCLRSVGSKETRITHLPHSSSQILGLPHFAPKAVFIRYFYQQHTDRLWGNGLFCTTLISTFFFKAYYSTELIINSHYYRIKNGVGER